jgi:hypothetical protein
MRLGFITMTLLAVLVALYSFRFFGVLDGFWLGVDSGIGNVIKADPVGALIHMLVAPVALLLGPIQFIPKLRESYRSVHRWTGRVYVAACVIAGLAGFCHRLSCIWWSGSRLGIWNLGGALDRHDGRGMEGSYARPI